MLNTTTNTAPTIAQQADPFSTMEELNDISKLSDNDHYFFSKLDITPISVPMNKLSLRIDIATGKYNGHLHLCQPSVNHHNVFQTAD